MSAKSKPTVIAGKELSLSNLDKVMYPGNGFTKGQVIDFYTGIAKYILPHLKDRPITMKRFPNGVGGQHFYEKDAPGFTPQWIKTFPISRTSVEATINYILINDLPTLVWSANMANLEVHPFLAKVPRVDSPTMVVFDLDPGEGADILNSCETAFWVKRLLDRLDLQSFAKVSGSKGIHLYVPLNTEVTYASTQPFAKSIAKLLASEHRDSIVSEMPKAKRKGKVFVDWSQNSEHKSTVAVYSLRAKGDLPFVAMPVTWDELQKAVKRRDPSLLFFEPEAAVKRVKKVGDLFGPVLSLKQSLPKAFLDLSGDTTGSDKAQNVTSLETYRQKRNFSKTPEPPPSIPQSSVQGSRRLFVIQKHAASHLHYDFRLEMGGTLKSWAVPKGPPYDLKERRLAMATEDHPMEYARFEGIIPKGEYGGGTVMVWDIGTYELIDGNYWKGKLHFFLNGKKLKGEWILVKGATGSGDGRDNTWYLIKGGSAIERPSEKEDDSSALTGRGLKEIAEAKTAIWHSNRNGSRDRDGTAENLNFDLESLPDAQVKFIEPMFARTVSKLPDNPDEWLYEIKLDGYRCLAGRTEKSVTLWSRRKNLLTKEFPEITRACELLEPNTLLDGEIVALDEAGRPSFNILQNFRSKAQQIQFYAFDLLVYRGKSLLTVPLQQRRSLLASALAAFVGPVRMSENFAGPARDIIAAAKELGLEGVIAKRKDSPYQPGKRSGLWVKQKLKRSQEFVIAGYTPDSPFDAVIVGYYDKGKLVYAAKVRNGFVPHLRRDVARKLQGLQIDTCPFANLPERRRTQWALTREEMKKCIWLRPELVAQIEFGEWTPDGHLREASFIGLREDKNPHEVVREVELTEN